MSLMALIVFSATFVWLATERHPRHMVVLTGAGVMWLLRLVTLREAFHQVNWTMLGIILGLFVIVGLLFEWNAFNLLGSWLIRSTQGNRLALFIMLPLLAGILSMFLNNIAVMLFLSLITLEICHTARLDPAVLITSEVCAANAGGGATLIGSPPNLAMGTAMGYSFRRVLVHMGPFSVFSIFLILLVYFLIHRNELRGTFPPNTLNPRWKALPKKMLLNIWRRVDWQTLLFFVGLFILVGTLEKAGVFRLLAELLTTRHHSALSMSLLFLGMAAVVSAFVDNIPMALSMAYVIKNMHAMPGAPPESLLVWSALIGLTLGGNMTPIGASPNILAYSVLERSGTKMGWKQWAVLTVPPTLMALAGVTFFIWIKYGAGWY